MSRTIIYEEDVSQFYGDTGEITQQHKRRTFKSPTVETDEFIKGSKYLSLIFAYNGIPLTLIPITYVLAERMEFKTNRIYLLKNVKQEIADILGVSLHMVETHIRNLIKYNIIKRVSRGCYEVNSFLFSTGSTIETREMQAHFDIDHDAYYVEAKQVNRITGETVRKAVIDYNEKQLRDARSNKKKNLPGQISLRDFEESSHDNDN